MSEAGARAGGDASPRRDDPAALVSFAPHHAGGVVDVIRSVFDEHGMTFDLEDFDGDLRDVAASYAGRGGCFFVLVDGGRVVGTVGAVPKDGTTSCELKRLYLMPTHRGGRPR